MTKVSIPFLPSIEQRLSGWVAIQERLARVPEVRVRPSITLSREFGCEGFPLAQELQVRLESLTGEPWVIHDKALLEAVATREDIPLRILKHLGDRSRDLEALGLMPSAYHGHDEAFDKLARHLVPLAEAGNAILVGRGGAALCQGLRNCLHVRLVAPLAWRVDSVARRQGMPHDQAEAYVKENSHLRDAFFKERLGVDPGATHLFDAIYSNDRQPVSVIAASILALLRETWPDPALFRD